MLRLRSVCSIRWEAPDLKRRPLASKEGTFVFLRAPRYARHMTMDADNSRPAVDVESVLRNLRLVLAHDAASGHHSSEMAALETLVRSMARDGVQRDQP